MRYLDELKWSPDFDIEDLSSMGMKQILALAKIISDEDAVEEPDHWDLCFLLKEKVEELDTCILRLTGEKLKFLSREKTEG